MYSSICLTTSGGYKTPFSLMPSFKIYSGISSFLNSLLFSLPIFFKSSVLLTK